MLILIIVFKYINGYLISKDRFSISWSKITIYTYLIIFIYFFNNLFLIIISKFYLPLIKNKYILFKNT